MDSENICEWSEEMDCKDPLALEGNAENSANSYPIDVSIVKKEDQHWDENHESSFMNLVEHELNFDIKHECVEDEDDSGLANFIHVQGPLPLKLKKNLEDKKCSESELSSDCSDFTESSSKIEKGIVNSEENVNCFPEAEFSDDDDGNESNKNGVEELVCVKDGLDIHSNGLKNNVKEKPHVCPECGKGFAQKESLKEHLRIHSNERPFKCDVCEKSFRTNRILIRHKRVHTGEKPYKCKLCDNSFTQSGTLAEHMKTHYGYYPYACKDCGKKFRRKRALKLHTMLHTNEKPFPCSECERSFRRKDQLEFHMNKHTQEKVFPCSECNKKYFTKSDLVEHVRSHTGERPFVCPHCGKGFATKRSFKYHVGGHADGETYACTQCNSTFDRKNNLARHMKIHETNGRNMNKKCDICDKAYPGKYELEVHLRTHTGEKPFSCNKCEKAFGCKSYLKRHMEIHTNNVHICVDCGKTFTRKLYFDIHLKKHAARVKQEPSLEHAAD